jgi:hypothetical protein
LIARGARYAALWQAYLDGTAELRAIGEVQP